LALTTVYCSVSSAPALWICNTSAKFSLGLV
jgi:hypothetical protein